METRTAIEMLRTAQLRIERDALLRGLGDLDVSTRPPGTLCTRPRSPFAAG